MRSADPPAPRARWKEAARRAGRAAGWLLGLAALALVAQQAWTRRTQWLPLWQRLEAADIALALALCLAMQIAFGLAWHLFARGRWVPQQLYADQLRWGQSLPAKYLPGKIWQGVARSALYADERRPTLTFVLFVREQLLSLGISAAIAAAAAPAALSPRLGLPFQAGLLAFAVAVSVAAVWRRLPAALAARLPAALAGWNQGLPTRAVLARVWLLQWLAYAAMVGAFAVLVAGFGLRIGLAQAASALCLAGLAGVLAVLVPAGLGVREAGLFWCLAPLVGAGNAAMLALAWRLAITAGEALFAALSFALGALRGR
ncbi:flippase-like domain-containing protein [Lysobacter sp. K5869]|uniref:lysylphosphatidylglycerol synthase domain-containing protein n=1 Tax=Lysobacter sp. K5869 TaxID=2820808 RepID=UPI001C063E98|nr:lysylphosphatidylglycerol synthase domain-containing protein [Lysobacter sp. K5869]QWP77064.1 flippase-like domain-containing protein [Lysobacter sp. K5869]